MKTTNSIFAKYLIIPLLSVSSFTLMSTNSYAVNTECGVDYNSYQNNYGGSIKSFQPNGYAFAAINPDGRIATWGSDLWSLGIVNSAPTDTGYVRIASASEAFAAMKADGSITAWGSIQWGGSGAPIDSGYVSIASTYQAFAAMKADGSITVWGNSEWGGSGAPSDSGYVSIASTWSAFAAMKADGSITAWGNGGNGGSGAPTDSGYVSIASNISAFAAMKADGSITAWGSNTATGGSIGAPTGSGYVSIASNSTGFAAMKADGSITSWGGSTDGNAPIDSGYISIASTNYAFAAMKADGSITAWGNAGSGAPTDSGYVSIASTRSAFAAMKADGSITSWWGSTDGNAPIDSGYVSIFATENAFAAMKADGSITAWGDSEWGGSGAPSGSGYVSINGVGPNTPKDCSFSLEPVSKQTSFLSFPLDCGDKDCTFNYSQGAYTPNSINSVMDHQMDSIYTNPDGVVTAFTGETSKGTAENQGCYPKVGGGLFNVIELYRGTNDGCLPDQGLNYDNHPGYDYRAQYGTPVKASAGGKVVKILNTATNAYGRCVPRGISAGCDHWGFVGIDHGNGYVTQYGHLSKIDVNAGQTVINGQIIGLSGDTGVSGAPHLHFEVLKESKGKQYGYAFVDPYGWEGAPEIDYLAQINETENIRLWKYDPRGCLLNWAEQHYDYLFAPQSAATSVLYPYIYRYYKNTNSYLGVSSISNHVLYLGPDRVFLDVGNLSDWLLTANCQSPISP